MVRVRSRYFCKTSAEIAVDLVADLDAEFVGIVLEERLHGVGDGEHRLFAALDRERSPSWPPAATFIASSIWLMMLCMMAVKLVDCAPASPASRRSRRPDPRAFNSSSDLRDHAFDMGAEVLDRRQRAGDPVIGSRGRPATVGVL
jgi:hypothetical protein